MIQIIQIHQFKQSYPFGLQKQTENTFVQIIRKFTTNKQLESYKSNLIFFKQHCNIHEFLIKLDSFVSEENQLQIYYEYQPVSILMFLKKKSKQYKIKQSLSEIQQSKEKLIIQILNTINLTIQSIITFMINKKILAVLSIQSIAITTNNKLKFFIDPDFQILPNEQTDDALEILNQYYKTQKKKLQIQLQQKLENFFNKKLKTKKANFIIQGTKLVFVKQEQQNQKVNLNNPFNNIEKNMHYFAKNTKNTQSMVQKKQKNTNSETNGTEIAMLQTKNIKFNIANILDQKKIQKNQNSQNQTIRTSVDPQGAQGFLNHKIPLATQNLEKQFKKSFNQVNNQQAQKLHHKSDTQSNQPSTSLKQIKNYFQFNDDFNKDASFYPEEFIRQDSISQFQGYEDQLEKQLEDLKRTTIQRDFQDQSDILYRNQLEGVYTKLNKDKGENIGFHDIKKQNQLNSGLNRPNNKIPLSSHNQQIFNNRLSFDPRFIVNFQESSKNSQQVINQIKNFKSTNNLQKTTNKTDSNVNRSITKKSNIDIKNNLIISNQNNNQNNYNSQSREQNEITYQIIASNSKKQQKNNNLQINHKQQEIMQDMIKKGIININSNMNNSNNNSKQLQKSGGYNNNSKDTIDQVNFIVNKYGNNKNGDKGQVSLKNIEQNKINSLKLNHQSKSNEQQIQEGRLNQNNINQKFSPNKNEEIQKIINKIKNNSQNQNNNFNNFNSTNLGNIFNRQSIMYQKQIDFEKFGTNLTSNNMRQIAPNVQNGQNQQKNKSQTNERKIINISQQNHHLMHNSSDMSPIKSRIPTQKDQIIAVDNSISSNNHLKSSNNKTSSFVSNNHILDKEYIQKIQKAKTKAQQIMRLVKQRKLQHNI